MAQVLTFRPPLRPLHRWPSSTSSLSPFLSSSAKPNQNPNSDWASLQLKLKSRPRFSCLFSNNSREEQARKALESALGEKKNEFERWNKEIQKREEMGGGGASGGGGWFGWRRWFGGFNSDDFWKEAQQAALAIIGIIFMYLVVAKGEVILAVIFNPLLFALRWTRNGFTLLSSRLLRKIQPAGSYANLDETPKDEAISRPSAKENVIRKWRND